MVRLYDRDAALVAAVLPLVVALRRASVGDKYGQAAEALRNLRTTEIREGDPLHKRALIDAWLESIVAAIKDQGGSLGAGQPR
jgi:hypothetical protein